MQGESSRREIGALEWQNQTLRQQVSLVRRFEIVISFSSVAYRCVQEQSSRREINNLKQGLRSSESLVADFQKSLELRDSELGGTEGRGIQ